MFAFSKINVCSAEPHGEGSGFGGLGQSIPWSSAPNAGNLPTPNPDHAAQTNSEAADFALDTAREIVLCVARIRNEQFRSKVSHVLELGEMSHSRPERVQSLESFLRSCLSEESFEVRKIAMMIAKLDGEINFDNGQNSAEYSILHHIQDLLFPFVIHPATKREIVRKVNAGEAVISECVALNVGAAAALADGSKKIHFVQNDSGKISTQNSLMVVSLPTTNPAPNNRAYATILDLADQAGANWGDEVFGKSLAGEISDQDLRKAGTLLASRLGSKVYFCMVKLPEREPERTLLVTAFSHIRALVPNILFFEAYTSAHSRTKAAEEVMLRIVGDRLRNKQNSRSGVSS